MSRAILAGDGRGSLMAAALDSDWAGVSSRPRMRFEPQGAGRLRGIDRYLVPPCCFIATSMNFSMMPTTERHRELVTYLAAKCPALRKAQVMRIRRLAAANQTRLFGHMSDMLAVANPARL